MTVLKRTTAVVLVLATLAAALFLWRAYDAGYRLYVVRTGSMSPTYPAGDLVVDRPAEAKKISRGDVITFLHSGENDLVTHRVTAVKEAGFKTKGDANRTPDVWTVNEKQIRGVVTGHLANMGYVVVFLRQPAGTLGLMTSAISMLLLWGLFFPAREIAPASAAGPATFPRQRRGGSAATPVGVEVQPAVTQSG